MSAKARAARRRGSGDLLAADGFAVLGHVEVPAWQAYVDTVAERLGIAGGDALFDVGCGAGAFLCPFRAAGHPVGGLDDSPPLIATARRAMPDRAFEVGEAIALRTAARYDWVCANGVFLYFPDADYARGVLQRMAAKARKGLAILDVPDLATRDRALAARRAAYTGRDHEADYRGLEHVFLARDWWPEQAAAPGPRLRRPRPAPRRLPACALSLQRLPAQARRRAMIRSWLEVESPAERLWLAVRIRRHRARGRRIVHLLHIGKTGGSALKSSLGWRRVTPSCFVVAHVHAFRLRDVPPGDGVVFFLRDWYREHDACIALCERHFGLAPAARAGSPWNR
jgi:hypothetical protein